MKKLHLYLVVLAVALISTACVKVNLDIDVSDDGSATLSGLIAVDADQLSSLAEDLGEDAAVGGREEICADFTDENSFDDGGTDLSTKPYDNDGFCGIEFSGQLSPEEVEAQLGDLTDSNDGTLRREGDGWYFELLLSEQALGTDDLDDAGAFFDLDDLFGGAEYVIRVKLPGRQVEHNADEIESDGTLVWDIDLLNPPARIFARTEPGEPITGDGGDDGGGGGGNTLGIILIVLIVLALLGGVAYLLLRKRGDNETVDAAEPGFGGLDAPPAAGGAAAAFPTDSPSTPEDAAAAGAPPPVGGDAWAAPGGDPSAAQPPAADPWAPAGQDPAIGEPTTPAEWAPPVPETEPQPLAEPAAEWAPPVPETEPQPLAEPEPEPVAQPEPQPAAEVPTVAASPTPEQATGEPVWDSDRGQYVQWDPNAGHWLDFDDATQTWSPRT